MKIGNFPEILRGALPTPPPIWIRSWFGHRCVPFLIGIFVVLQAAARSRNSNTWRKWCRCWARWCARKWHWWARWPCWWSAPRRSKRSCWPSRRWPYRKWCCWKNSKAVAAAAATAATSSRPIGRRTRTTGTLISWRTPASRARRLPPPARPSWRRPNNISSSNSTSKCNRCIRRTNRTAITGPFDPGESPVPAQCLPRSGGGALRQVCHSAPGGWWTHCRQPKNNACPSPDNRPWHESYPGASVSLAKTLSNSSRTSAPAPPPFFPPAAVRVVIKTPIERARRPPCPVLSTDKTKPSTRVRVPFAPVPRTGSPTFRPRWTRP